MWKYICFVFFSFLVLQQFVEGNEDVKLENCDDDSDCKNISNSYCNSEDFCECKEGYVNTQNNSMCLPLAIKIGDKCEIPEQCSNITSAECIRKTCVVPQAVTDLPAVSTPVNVTLSGKQCTVNANCTLPNNICENGTCVLPPLPVVPKINLKIPIIGMPCFNDTECQLEGTACADKLCKCKEDFVPSQNLKSCLPKAKSVGDKCSETAQCISLNGSLCQNEKCTQTIEKFMKAFADNAPSIPTLSIGVTCQKDDECKSIKNAACLENVCQCVHNYVTSLQSNSCLLKATKEGDPCEIDKQCEDVKGAICNKNKCVKPALAGTKMGSPGGAPSMRISGLLAAILFLKICFF